MSWLSEANNDRIEALKSGTGFVENEEGEYPMDWQERMEEKLNALNGLNEQVAQLVGLIQMVHQEGVETRQMLVEVREEVQEVRQEVQEVRQEVQEVRQEGLETRRMLQSVETKVDQIRGSIVQDLAAVEFTVHKAASDIAALKLAR